MVSYDFSPASALTQARMRLEPLVLGDHVDIGASVGHQVNVDVFVGNFVHYIAFTHHAIRVIIGLYLIVG